MQDWMIYGANGYTGELVARLAVGRGERPILAGRNAAAIGALAAELGLEARVADLHDPVALRAILDGVRVVAHCAGPFRATAAPMVDACLATGVHYLDVTGEIGVFEEVFARHDDAVAAGVVLLPGAGFDVVPTDCLAATLSAALPGATTLELAFRAGGGLSPGTARSSLEGMAGGGRVRRAGVLVPAAVGTPRRRVPFPSGAATVSAIRWGDLVTAYRSTGIPEITTYTVLPPGAGISAVIAWAPVRSLAGRLAGVFVHGPDETRRGRTRTEVWGEVTDSAGNRV
ncbi:MAG TPA: saccharopine dehydrogenase NADP-binding domain-containing protein, partial [Micromonosporaceae bacterium]